MNYLEELIQSLTEEELDTISKMKMTETESHYWRELLSNPAILLASGDSGTQSVSAPSLYKLRSILYTKILARVAGNGELEKIVFLLKKRLRAPMVRQLKVAERKIGTQLEGIDREKFFQRLFQATFPWSMDHYDKDLIAKYGDKYLRARVHPIEGDDILIESYQILFDLQGVTLRRDTQEEVHSKLQTFYQRLKSGTHFEAQIVVLRALVEYHLRSPKGSTQEAWQYSEQIIDITKNNLDIFTSRQLWSASLISAELLMYLGRFPEAYERYHNLYLNLPPTFNLSGYHEISYVQCCIITNHVEEIRSVFDEALRHRGILRSAIPIDFKLQRIYFNLLCNNPSEAISDINDCLQRKNDIVLTYYDECEIRALEVAYYCITNDLKFAESLIKRHLKFCEYHSEKNVNPFTPQFLRLARAIILEREGLGSLKPHHLRKIESFKCISKTASPYMYYLILQIMKGTTSMEVRLPITEPEPAP